MRIAVVSDIHGNRTAFEAVLADLRETSPDLIFHGGDLADSGSSPAEIVDHIRDLGWPGVLGNTDEMLFRPESLEAFAAQAPHLQSLFNVIREIAAHAREALGTQRLAWLSALPKQQIHETMALVHASPESPWLAVADDTYASLARPIVVHGHLHTPFIRQLPTFTLANTGSAGLPYDGDTRASYLLLDDNQPTIRRVEYDIARETQALTANRAPHAPWIARMLATGRFEMPPAT